MTTLPSLLSTLAATAFRSTVLAVSGVVGLGPENWKSGDFELEFSTAVSLRVSELWNTYARLAIRGGFLDYAEGGWLTLLASNVYRVTRIPAAFGSGEWTGTNATGTTLGPYAIGDLVFVHDTSGKTYRNAEAVSFVAGVNDPIAIVADEVGTDSDAAPGEISLQTVVVGLSGSNASAVLGVDEELDPALRARCRLKPASFSVNGPSGAFEFISLTPVDLDLGRWSHGVAVNRVQVTSNEAGSVLMRIAGPNGAITAPNVALVDTAIQENAVPEFGTATTESCVEVEIPVEYTLWVPSDSGVLPADTEAAASVAIARHFASIPIGGAKPDLVVYLNRLEAVIVQAARDLGGDTNVQDVIQVLVTSPSSDTALDVDEVPKAGAITATIVQVDP